MILPSWINRANLYYAGLILMLVALPLSKYLMSVSQLYLSALWLLDPQLLQKWKQFFKNRAAIVLVSLFFIHVIGLLWTTDFDYAVKDLRTKVPLLALPVIVATSPKVSRSLFHYLMLIFIVANVLGTIASMHELLTRDITEIRKISLFMSHIRFSLNICVAIFSGFYMIFISEFFSLKIKILLFVTIVWLLVFLFILESVTGLAIVLTVTFVLCVLAAFKSGIKLMKASSIIILIAIPVSLFFYAKSLYEDYVPDKPFVYEGMDLTTKQGNYYANDTTLMLAENGHWVGQYLHWGEIREEWSKRSSINFDSVGNSGHFVRYTLLRYLTSKGLRKDAEAMKKLTDEDIRNVENGIANINQLVESSIQNRMRTIVWELMLYRSTGYLSGHSVAQRIEFWNAGIRIIKKNFWFGTGTGDIKNAYENEYVEMNTQLEPQFRWRTHNQYIAIFAALGVFGCLWFLFILCYPGFRLRMFNDFFYLVFFLILSLSMLTEDTIENQAGVTFFAFFTVFFLFARSEKAVMFSKT
ncbi:MAG: O-antigen ligase family protein [Bacteroidales bacterium]|nr:O-antigen ligase family protein [Bacteroidales bacterium]